MRTFLALLLLLLGTAVPALAQDAPPDNTLVLGRAADAIYLDPAMFLDNESAMVIENIFDGLVRYADDSTRVEPALAESWSVSEDGLEWTFALREGVRFHDGAPFDAHAAAFSLRRKTDPDHPAFREEFQGMDKSLEVVEEVRALDDQTLRIRLSRPYAPLLNALATHSSYMVSPDAVQRLGKDFAEHPVGTGPFRFVSWKKGRQVALERNPDYWGGAPHLHRVVFRVIADPDLRFLALKTGTIHVMDGPTPEQVPELRKRADLELHTSASLNVGYLAMNTQRPPFDRPEVRRAVVHAVNRQALIRLIYRDLALPAKNPLPPAMWGYNDAVEAYAYDSDRSRRLLEQAGLDGPVECTLWVMPVSRPYMPSPEQTAMVLKDSLAAVGIRARLVTKPWADYLAGVYAGEHDLCLLGWIGTGDPSNFLDNLLHGRSAEPPHASNVALYRNPEVDALLDQAVREPDMGARTLLYERVQELVHADAPWLPLAHALSVMATRTGVQGVVQHPTGVYRLHTARINP